MLTLPTALRAAFKEPFGPVYAEADDLLADASSEDADAPLVAVGDVVTFHLRRAGRPPDVAVVDGKTKREAVGEEIRRAVETGRLVEVENEPGTVSVALVEALVAALDDPDPTTLLVEGEEDLATLRRCSPRPSVRPSSTASLTREWSASPSPTRPKARCGTSSRGSTATSTPSSRPSTPETRARSSLRNPFTCFGGNYG